MRRAKEFHLVNISFIDMLAGALGATIILFIIVPKMSFFDLKKLKALDSLDVKKAHMDSMVAKLEPIVPEKEYRDLVASSVSLQSSIENLKSEIRTVQNTLNVKTIQYSHVAQKYDRAMQTIRTIQQQLAGNPDEEELKRIHAELKAAQTALSPGPTDVSLVASGNQSSPGITPPDASLSRGDAAMGKEPPLIILINWDDKDDKVHLYMRSAGTSNWVFYQNNHRKAGFGTWDDNLANYEDLPYEAIVQNDNLVPGTYEIYAQTASAKTGSVEVSGFISMKINDGPVKRFNILSRKINVAKPPFEDNSGSTKLGTLTVSGDDIGWNPN